MHFKKVATGALSSPVLSVFAMGGRQDLMGGADGAVFEETFTDMGLPYSYIRQV